MLFKFAIKIDLLSSINFKIIAKNARIIIMIIIILMFQLRVPEETEVHIKQIVIQCTYNNTTFLCWTESETK